MSSAALSSTALPFKIQKRPRILLRGSWHSINIGDIAHTVGTINLIKTYLPEVEIILWPKNVKDGVKEMILRRFPNLQIIQKEHEVQSAFKECDFFLHGSGPVLVGQDELLRWRKKTGKPYGVFGIGIGNKRAVEQRDLLSHAEFLFFRETISLQRARDNRVECPIMKFGPWEANQQPDAALRGIISAGILNQRTSLGMLVHCDKVRSMR